jgi:hypothetical protein
MPQPKQVHDAAKNAAPPVSTKEYLALANFIQGKDRVYKKDPHAEAVRTAAELYDHRDYVAAYECFKPAYDKVVTDMQRVLARNIEFEANKLAKAQRKPIATAKENIVAMRAQAQQVIDQFDRLLRDIESKPLVRHHIKRGGWAAAPAPAAEEAAPTTLASTAETRIDAPALEPIDTEIEIGGRRYVKRPYAPPAVGTLYLVRDKAKAERAIRVLGRSEDAAQVQVEIVDGGGRSRPPIQLAVDSLVRQAAKGWCSLLVAALGSENSSVAAEPADANAPDRGMLRIDIQNFGRCCADIARANIKFSTQLIKDVGDGPFRAGKYEHAFLTFEQFAVGFNAAVAASRREIEEGRRKLTAEKGKLSGKEIQERTAAFIRGEQLIHSAEREFTTILEGLRMYLRAGQEQTPSAE